jgi:hypothetical protein
MSKKRLNFLNRVQAVLTEYQKHNDGTRAVSMIWIAFINPKFHISCNTLRRYLSINVTQERKKLSKVKK